jgi:ribulose-5-phosphate 4-epimerase/fuculose-1-phosphate aldolase
MTAMWWAATRSGPPMPPGSSSTAVHKAKPYVTAECHTYGKAWSTFSRKLTLINQDMTCFYGDDQAVYHEFGGIISSEEEGKRLAAALGPNGKALILRDHDLLVSHMLPV